MKCSSALHLFYDFSRRTNQFIDPAGISGTDTAPSTQPQHSRRHPPPPTRIVSTYVICAKKMYDYMEERWVGSPLRRIVSIYQISGAFMSSTRRFILQFEFLRQKMSVFGLQQHFYIIHVGFVCCSHTASSKRRTERTMPICSIVPQVPHYVWHNILLQTQKELSNNNGGVFMFLNEINLVFVSFQEYSLLVFTMRSCFITSSSL